MATSLATRSALYAVTAATFVTPLLALASFAGCSDDTKKNTPPPLVLREDDAAKPDASFPDPPDTALPPVPDAGGPKGTIYVQTGRALQVYDPYTKGLRDVGKFTCLSADDLMYDVAVDRDNNIYGTTRNDRFVKIDPLSGACSQIRQGTEDEYPALIAFVPRGTLDPANDALVGFSDDVYQRIDVRTGVVTMIGTLNPPDASAPYYASGDLIYAGQSGMFLTAQLYSGTPDSKDSFIRFDPKTGRRLTVVGSTGYQNLFGLGYWGGSIFAFTTPGEILQLNPQTAAATLVKRIDAGPPKDGGPDPVFYGAGSTTVAPETPRP